MFVCLGYVHVAKDKWGNSDPKTRPCIFLGYGDDEFGYRLAKKKVIWSRDIVFMEEKTIANLEPRRTTSSESTDRDRLEKARVYPNESQIPVEDQYDQTGFRQETVSTEGGQNAETGQDPKSDLEEDPATENVA